jgi:hypothetical protein
VSFPYKEIEAHKNYSYAYEEPKEGNNYRTYPLLFGGFITASENVTI